MHEQLIAHRLGGMILLDNVVDMADNRGDEEGDDERGDIVVIGPDADEDGVQDSEEGEPPGNTIDDHGLRVGGGELVDDGTKKEEVDDGPSEERPVGRCEVGLLDAPVDGVRGNYGVDVRPQEEEVNDDVDEFEEDAFFPLCRGHFCCPSVGGRERGAEEVSGQIEGVLYRGRGVIKGRHR